MRKILLFMAFALSILDLSAQSMEWLFRPGKYHAIEYMGHDLFKVRNLQGEYGVISAQGKEVLEVKYDSITAFVEERALVLDKHGKRIYAILGAEGDLVRSFENEMYSTAITPYYKEGLLGFRQEDGLCGYLDMNGKIAIRPRFYLVTPFQHGFATVQYSHQDAGSEGYYGLITKAGTSGVVSDKKFLFLSSAVDGYLFGLTSSVRGGNVLRVMKITENELKDVDKIESKLFIDISDDFTNLSCQNGHRYFIDKEWRISGANYKYSLPYTISDTKNFVEQSSELLSKQFTEKGMQITYMGKPIMEHSFNNVATFEKKYAIVYSKTKQVGVLKLNPSAGIELVESIDAVEFYHNPLPADLSANVEELDSRYSVKIEVDMKDVNPDQLKCYLNKEGYLSYAPLRKDEDTWYLHIPYFYPDSIYNTERMNHVDVAVTYDGLEWMHRSIKIVSKHRPGYDITIHGQNVTDDQGKAVLMIKVKSVNGVSNVNTKVEIPGMKPVTFKGNLCEIPISVSVPSDTSKTFTYMVKVSEEGCPTMSGTVSKVVVNPGKKPVPKEKKKINLI